MRTPGFFAGCLCLMLPPSSVIAQQSEPGTVRAYQISEPIRTDGLLREPAWNRAKRITNFTQRELSEGEPVTERTEVAILYDDRSLYVGFWGYDSEPEKLISKKMQRDFDFDSEDNFEFIIDTYNDDRNGYLFVTNPNGAKADAVVINNGEGVNEDWDGVWYVAARVTDEGWFAEFEIPLSTLKFHSLPDQTWGINFERNIRRKREQALWQGWSRDSELEQVTRAGTLVGLEGISSVKLVDLRPYVLGAIEAPQALDRQTVGDLGADVSYLITPTVKLNFTLNPDFGQVESDRARVNLTRFSLFFPEKREFFLEGRAFFEFDLGRRIIPFFSRRIGLDEDRSSISILGGARLLGKLGGATLGAMLLQTAKHGETPSTNFTTLRWKQDLGEQSTIGLLSTTKFQPGRVNTTNGADFRYATARLFGDKNFVAGAAVAQSYTSDADNEIAWAHRLFISYPNDLVEFDAAWNRASGDFNPEVGFLRREAFQEFFMELQFNPRPRFIPWIRKTEIKPLDINYFIDDETGEMQSVFMEFRPLGFATKSGEFVEFNIQRLAENLIEDFEINDGVIIPPDTYWFTRFEVQGSTFSGRPVSSDFGINWGGFFDGSRTELEARLVWRPSKYLSLSTDYQRNRISLPAGSFQVEEIGGRADFAFSPSLFGAVFGQWNSEDHEVLLNLRINWIPRPGTDLFFVINQGADTHLSPWLSTGTTVATKLVWRFTL